MAAVELYPGRSSMFSKWARAHQKSLPLLVDLDSGSWCEVATERPGDEPYLAGCTS